MQRRKNNEEAAISRIADTLGGDRDSDDYTHVRHSHIDYDDIEENNALDPLIAGEKTVSDFMGEYEILLKSFQGLSPAERLEVGHKTRLRLAVFEDSEVDDLAATEAFTNETSLGMSLVVVFYSCIMFSLDLFCSKIGPFSISFLSSFHPSLSLSLSLSLSPSLPLTSLTQHNTCICLLPNRLYVSTHLFSCRVVGIPPFASEFFIFHPRAVCPSH